MIVTPRDNDDLVSDYFPIFNRVLVFPFTVPPPNVA